jgi:hypothetical protein
VSQPYVQQPAPVYAAAPPVAPPVSPGRLGGQKLVALAVAGVLVAGGGGVLLGKALSNDGGPPVAAGGGPIEATTTTVFGGGGTTPTTPAPQTTLAPGTTLAPTTTTQPQGGGGGSVSLANGVVNVPVPSGWSANGGDDYVVLEQPGFYVYIDASDFGEGLDAVGLASALVDEWIAGDPVYSQVQRSDATSLEASGTVQSFAVANYSAVWGSTSVSFQMCGSIWVAVREDGWILQAQLEAEGETPDDACNRHGAALENGPFGQVIGGAVADFGSR